MQASGHPTTSSTAPPMCPSWPRFRISDRRPICVHELTLTHTYAGLHLRCDPRHRRVSGPDRPRGLPKCPYRPPGSLYSILSLGREP